MERLPADIQSKVVREASEMCFSDVLKELQTAQSFAMRTYTAGQDERALYHIELLTFARFTRIVRCLYS